MKLGLRVVTTLFAFALCHAEDIVEQLLEQLKDTTPQTQLNNGNHSILSHTLSEVMTNIISRGMIQLAVELDHTISANKNYQENVLFSPSCLQVTLATILLGSRGKTFEEITKFLNFDDPTLTSHTEIFHQILSMNLKNYNWKQNFISYYPFAQCSPAFFLQKSYPLTQQFESASKQLYDGEIISVDFAENDKNAKDAINNWVQQKTKDRVQNFMYDLSNSENKISVSSVWSFKGEWSEKFEKYPTRLPFKTEAEKSVYVDMLCQDNNFPFYDDEEAGLRIAGVPYRGFEVMMYFILPKSNDDSALRKIKKTLTSEKIDELITKMDQKQLLLCFPKMNLSSNLNLKDYLKNLGISSIFDPKTADLGLMSPGNLGNSPQISEEPSKPSPMDSTFLVARFGGMDMETVDRVMGDKADDKISGSSSFSRADSTDINPASNDETKKSKNYSLEFTSPDSETQPPTTSPPYQTTNRYPQVLKESDWSLPTDQSLPLISPSYSRQQVYSPNSETSAKSSFVVHITPREQSSSPRETTTIEASMESEIRELPTPTTLKKFLERVSNIPQEISTNPDEFRETMVTPQSEVRVGAPSRPNTNNPRRKSPTSPTTSQQPRMKVSNISDGSSMKPKSQKHRNGRPIQLTYEFPNGQRPNFKWIEPLEPPTKIPKALERFGPVRESHDQTPPLRFPPIVETDPSTDEYILDGSYNFEDRCNLYIYEQWPHAIKWQQIPRCKRSIGNFSSLAGLDMVREKTMTSNPGLSVQDFIHVVDVNMYHGGTIEKKSNDTEAKPVYASSNSEYMIVDEPFLMLITYNPSRSIWFWGSINKPLPSYNAP
ncbi:hypothetical protein QAD02_006120 [Eretmocerus hayati]|uniref:Uncharacterized protein n=1 Tax=Eretmocerus hayati TaxID=131215 RepID=A0ACC2N136_9HYME|nr:hypothetical protein QAD02_006120 [Eretmocerus hayati]